jgi:hypothetical protein
MYSRDVVFREVGSKSKLEEIFQTEDDLEKVRFELRNEEDDLDELTKLEEEVEQPTPTSRRLAKILKPVKMYSLSSIPHLC